MSGEFNRSAYHDEYREALLAIVEAKAAGSEIAEPATTPVAGVTDLMAAVEASVVAAKAARVSLAPLNLAAAASKRPRKATPAPVLVVGVQSGAEVAQVRRRKSA